MNNNIRKHIISVLVQNRPGVLARVSGLFARRGYNIDSLAVSATEQPTISRMTIATMGDDRHLEQVIKQLDKLIEVINVFDHTGDNLIDREISLIKITATPKNRGEIMQIAAVFKAEIASISPKEQTMILELTGDSDKVDAFLETLSKFPILEMVRTGSVALVRGARST